MTAIDTKSLRAAAEAATPGTWSWWTSNSFRRLTADGGRDGGVLNSAGMGVNVSIEDAAYIAAAQPSTMIALLDERLAMIAELEVLRAAAPTSEDRRKKRSTPGDEKCARWLFGLVLDINSTARKPNWSMWADDVRRLREIDGHAHREICEMFKWAHDDSFWCANILSPKKLREKWDVLVAQRARPIAASRNAQASPKFNFANADRSGDRRAQAATLARHGIVVPDVEVDL